MFIITIQFAVHHVSLYCAPHHRCLVIITANLLFSDFVENCLKPRRKCAQKTQVIQHAWCLFSTHRRLCLFCLFKTWLSLDAQLFYTELFATYFFDSIPKKHLAKLVPNSFILISFLWGHFLRVRFYLFFYSDSCCDGVKKLILIRFRLAKSFFRLYVLVKKERHFFHSTISFAFIIFTSKKTVYFYRAKCVENMDMEGKERII